MALLFWLRLKLLLRIVGLLLLLALSIGAFVMRCHNRAEIFIQGRIYFTEADCYARMSRVRMIAEHQARIVHHHDFENYPEGVNSHTTAPFDYLILGVKSVLDGMVFRGRSESVLAPQTLDLAGALVSPLLGALTCFYLGIWAWFATRRLAPNSAFLRVVLATGPPLLFAVSPVLVEATILGRPDHQSLLVLLLAVAIGSELLLVKGGTKKEDREEEEEEDGTTSGDAPALQLVAGIAWGLALWVSLYEPVILLVAIALLLLVLNRASLLRKERFWELGAIVFLIAISFLVEGARFTWPSAEVTQYFPAWSKTIGELRHLSPFDARFPVWLGWSCFIAPLGLALTAWKLDRRAWLLLAVLVLLFGLSCWQMRWCYYLALVFAMSLPWQIAIVRRWWIAIPVLIVALFGTAKFWDETLFPNAEADMAANARRSERTYLRDVAMHLEGPPPQSFLAPWWESPPLAYWSRQPGVAGSSHESLPGIVDTARFYLDASGPDHRDAAAILAKRKIAYVIADATDRLTEPAAGLLLAQPARDCLAAALNDKPFDAAPYLVPVYQNSFFKIFAVDADKLSK